MKKRNYYIPVLLLIGMIFYLQGCSSSDDFSGCGNLNGGAASQIIGVASAGAPITGIVSLKDSKDAILGPIDIAPDGSFSFDVTGMTPPFYLYAEGTAGGRSYSLCSASISGGTANINPMTNLAVATAAGVNDPFAVYTNHTAIT